MAEKRRSIGAKFTLAQKRHKSITATIFLTRLLSAIKEFVVSIKGPLETPVGKGIRSLNVALRKELDLYSCVRPVKWFEGVPAPVKEPGKVNMTIFRENIEDVYAGVEFAAGTAEANEFIALAKKHGKSIREQSAIGIKPMSAFGSKRLIRKAMEYAVAGKMSECDACAQRQHHEVHRRRLQRLGLRTGES